MGKKIPMLKMEGVSKVFPGVKALDNVHITAYGGEVTALMGENGAGKSNKVGRRIRCYNNSSRNERY